MHNTPLKVKTSERNCTMVFHCLFYVLSPPKVIDIDVLTILYSLGPLIQFISSIKGPSLGQILKKIDCLVTNG